MCEQELEFLPWIEKISEKLTFLLLNVKEHRDIKETDYELLKILYKPYFNGEYPLFVTKMEGIAETSVQNVLFTDTISTSEDGIKIDYTVSEPKTEKNG